nr:hypothetical protein [Nitrosomonas nitrosa]
MVLIALSILTAACGVPGYMLYKKALADQQAAYQQALANKAAAYQPTMVKDSAVNQAESSPDLEQGKSVALNEQDKQQQAELQQKIREGEAEIPVRLAHKQLVDSFMGSTCNGKVGVEVEITEANKKGPWLRVKGSFRSFPTSEQQGLPVIETHLIGAYYLFGGFLALQSSGKPVEPLTREQIIEENRYRQQVDSEIKALERAYQVDLIKTMQRMGPMSPEQRTQANQELKIRENMINQKRLDLVARERERQKALSAPPPPPLVNLYLDLGRDSEGRGWVGAIDGEGFEGCNEIELASKNRNTTSVLPPITGKLAFQRAKPENYSISSKIAQIYWLNVAANQGYDDAFFYLGQAYEELSENKPENYQRALQFYQSAINKQNDARAQMALSNMYANGHGATVNTVKAQQLRNLATKTNREAAEVCTDPKTIALIYSILQEEQRKARTMGLIASFFTGIDMDLGDIRLVKVVTENVVSLNKPFICTVAGKRIDSSIDASSVPDFVYGGIDQNGNHFYYDNWLEKSGKTAVANLLDYLARELPFFSSFRIEPLGGKRYNLAYGSNSVAIDLP